MMSIYVYAGGLLVVVTGATLLFTACVMVLVFIEGVSILARTLRNAKRSAVQPNGDPLIGTYPRLTTVKSPAIAISGGDVRPPLHHF